MISVLRLGSATALFMTAAIVGHLLNGPAATAGTSSLLTDIAQTRGTVEFPNDSALRVLPAQADGCPVEMTASARGAALVRLSVDAPCRAGERLTVQHEALSFTVTLDDDGRAASEVPALAADAVFFAFFDDTEGAMAEIRMPEVILFERAGLMWEGEGGLSLHASEYGAAFGEQGYVWSGSPRSSTRAILGDGGFLTRLGDGLGEGAQMAEVYTFPAGTAPQAGTVELDVEASYGPGACGRDAVATAFRARGTEVSLTPVTVTLPDCDTARQGGFVRLNQALEPITLVGD